MRIQELVDGCGEDPGFFSQNVTEGHSSSGDDDSSGSSCGGEDVGRDRFKRRKKHSSTSYNKRTTITASTTVVKSTVVRGRQTVVTQAAMLAVRSEVCNGIGKGKKGRSMGRKKQLRKYIIYYYNYCIPFKLRKYLLII